MDTALVVYRSIVFGAVAVAGVLSWQQGWIHDLLGLRDAENAKASRFAPIFADEKRFERELLGTKWVRELPVGGKTYGKLLPAQYRISLEGSGATSDRDAWLQTRPTSQLFRGKSEKRATTFLRGVQSLVDERAGHIRGISMSPTLAGYQANWITVLFETGAIPKKLDPQWRAEATALLNESAYELSVMSHAWFQFDSAWITIGPQMTRDVVAHIKGTRKLSKERGGGLAYIMAHEIEHSVTSSDRAEERVSWMEEGIADVLAKWPGRAAAAAETLGLPYNPKLRTQPLDAVQDPRGGYPQHTIALRRMLEVAGIDHRDPEAFDDASELLQGVKVGQVPEHMAAHIVEFRSVAPRHADEIAELIRKVQGQPSAVADLAARVEVLAGSG